MVIGRNVHVYYSDMRNESRIFKITDTLIRNKIFDDIIIVGRVGEGLAPRELLHNKCKILRLDSPLFSLMTKTTVPRVLLWYAAACLRVYALAPQFLSVHSVSFLPMALAIKLLRPKISIIYEAHELETETNGASFIKRRVRSWIERISMPFVNHTVTVSPSIRDWYANRYRTDSVSLVMNCPQFRQRQDSDYLRQHFDLTADTVIFLYQGIMAPGRGIEKLVHVFERLPARAALVLLGYGPEYDRWHKFSQKSAKVHVHAAVAVEDVLDVTASADCGISFFEDTCLSHRFALPNKLFEFIQARVPVIVSPTIDQSQLVRKAQVGIVCESFEAKALAVACERFTIRPPEQIDSKLDTAAHVYSWDMQEKSVLRVYAPGVQ